MQYHRFRFGLKKNFSVLLCRIFGHRLNEKASYKWCNRCNLCYEECYYPEDYWVESGVVKLKGKEKHDYEVNKIFNKWN